MNMLELMKYLRIELPEDIQKAKLSGDLKRAQRMIGLRLCNAPAPMRHRLRLEEEILRRLPSQYPLNEREALKQIQEEIPDFTADELTEREDRGDADWFMIDGEPRLQKRFYASMKKVYPELAARAGMPADDKSLLDQNVRDMKENGEAAWKVKIRHTVQISDEAFEPGKVLVHIPVPASCINMEDIHILKTEPENAYTAALDSLSRTVSFDTELQENRPFSVEYEYISHVRYTDPDPAKATGGLREFADEEPQLVVTPLIRMLCDELAQDEKNPLVLARRFYDFVTQNVIYSYMREYITLGNIPDYCASRLRGDCGVQALLFIELCRCAGIEAQWQSGLFVTPEGIGHHDWAMFKVEPWGWMFADCSFGGAAYRAGDMERYNYYFGNLDPFRMAANNAVMQEFDPPKKHWRNDPYDNQSGEIEYESRGLSREEIISKAEVLEMTKIR